MVKFIKGGRGFVQDQPEVTLMNLHDRAVLNRMDSEGPWGSVANHWRVEARKQEAETFEALRAFMRGRVVGRVL